MILQTPACCGPGGSALGSGQAVSCPLLGVVPAKTGRCPIPGRAHPRNRLPATGRPGRTAGQLLRWTPARLQLRQAWTSARSGAQRHSTSGGSGLRAQPQAALRPCSRRGPGVPRLRYWLQPQAHPRCQTTPAGPRRHSPPQGTLSGSRGDGPRRPMQELQQGCLPTAHGAPADLYEASFHRRCWQMRLLAGQCPPKTPPSLKPPTPSPPTSLQCQRPCMPPQGTALHGSS
mmetsp:Transcript_41670/g.98805  ORF Transcript_41670/g.98805 Transcript_41670/m.98805 type:complete len:231 (-) Transcript_41670:967-1659(-)